MVFTLAGMHHVSALSAHIGRSHGFHTRVLGLRPLVRTVNQDEPSMYHLFYGDGAASPGSELTLFDLPHAVRERRGNHSISQTTFRVRDVTVLAWWAERLERFGVAHGGVTSRDGRGVLDFEDPEGMRLSLVEDGGAGAGVPWAESPVPAARQLRGLGYVELTVPQLEPTARFLTEALGFPHARQYDATHVFALGEGRVEQQVHVRMDAALPRARYGAGAVHHLALRVPEQAAMGEWAARLTELGYRHTGLVDRHWFTSLYVREPNGVLFELATDGPGFGPSDALNAERLTLPPFLEPRRAEIEGALQPLESEWN